METPLFDKSIHLRTVLVKRYLLVEFGLTGKCYDLLHSLHYFHTLTPHKAIPYRKLFTYISGGEFMNADSLRDLLEGNFFVMHKIKDVPYFEGRRPKEYRAYKMGKRGFELMIRYTALMQDDSLLTGDKIKSNCIASPGSTIQPPPPPKRTTNERKELLKLLNASDNTL